MDIGGEEGLEGLGLSGRDRSVEVSGEVVEVEDGLGLRVDKARGDGEILNPVGGGGVKRRVGPKAAENQADDQADCQANSPAIGAVASH